VDFCILHDEDILTEEGDERRRAHIRRENAKAMRLNQEIRGTAGPKTDIFVLQPSLERCVAIGGGASQKPRRVVEALEGLDISEYPQSLRDAVEALVR
jgi:hypothetical protein